MLEKLFIVRCLLTILRTVNSAQQESTLTTAGLASMLLSFVYFPEFCRTSSTQSQRDDASRHAAVKVEATQLASRGQTLPVLVSGRGAKFRLLAGRPALIKTRVDQRISVGKRHQNAKPDTASVVASTQKLTHESFCLKVTMRQLAGKKKEGELSLGSADAPARGVFSLGVIIESQTVSQ